MVGQAKREKYLQYDILEYVQCPATKYFRNRVPQFPFLLYFRLYCSVTLQNQGI